MRYAIDMKGTERISYHRDQYRARYAVLKAVRGGDLENLKDGNVKCVDCGAVASVYDHRDYNKPLDVSPVCHGCNIRRGSIAEKLKEVTFKSTSPGPKCPACESSQVLTNKDGLRRCRVCGEEWKK
jgi:ribosomal protein L37AE/L43A